VRVLAGHRYRFDGPAAMAVIGTDLFVANYGGGGSVTELDASTGALMKVLSGAAYHFTRPYCLAVVGPDLFVGSGTLDLKKPAGSVTEINASTGVLVRVLSGARYQFWDVGGMAVSGDDVFVLNVFGRSLTDSR
jgi:hypothetical protein